MAHPPMDLAFEKHVQDYLCSESYDFLKAVRIDVTYSVENTHAVGTQFKKETTSLSMVTN